MIKKITLILMLFCLFRLTAQQTVTAAGGNATGSNGSTSFTIGQPAYTNHTGTNGKITQGVQQPVEIFTLGNDDFPEIILMMSVYPNPSVANVTLSIQNHSLERMNCQLFDINGKIIQEQQINQNETQINMEHLAAAIYLLQVSDEHKTIKTFKIVKN